MSLPAINRLLPAQGLDLFYISNNHIKKRSDMQTAALHCLRSRNMPLGSHRNKLLTLPPILLHALPAVTLCFSQADYAETLHVPSYLILDLECSVI